MFSFLDNHDTATDAANLTTKTAAFKPTELTLKPGQSRAFL